MRPTQRKWHQPVFPYRALQNAPFMQSPPTVTMVDSAAPRCELGHTLASVANCNEAARASPLAVCKALSSSPFRTGNKTRLLPANRPHCLVVNSIMRSWRGDGAHAVRQFVGNCAACRLAPGDCRIHRTDNLCGGGRDSPDKEQNTNPETNRDDREPAQ